MGSYVNQYPNQIAAPAWAGDFGGREHIMPFPAKIDPTLFTDGLGVEIVVGAAGAAVDAETVPLAAAVSGLNGTVNAGTVLSFGGKKYARLAAPLNNGDTSLTTDPLPTALVDGDTANYSRYGRRTIRSGTYVGRTLAERDAGTAFGPADDTDDERYLVMFDVTDAFASDDIELYRHDSLVKENYLPDWDTISADANLLAALRSDYQCITGKD